VGWSWEERNLVGKRREYQIAQSQQFCSEEVGAGRRKRSTLEKSGEGQYSMGINRGMECREASPGDRILSSKRGKRRALRKGRGNEDDERFF